MEETADPVVREPNPHTSALDAPPAGTTTTAPSRPGELHGREGGRKDSPAAAILAVRRASGVKLRQRPGRAVARPGPTPAAERMPPEPPPRESDVGAFQKVCFFFLQQHMVS